MKTLQQIVQDHKSLDELMLENGGELTDEQQECIVDQWMSEIKSDISNKIDGYKYRQDSLDSAADNLKARAKMISNAARALTSMSDMLKNRLKITMIELTTDELVGNDFKFKLSSSKNSVEISDQSLIDKKYFKSEVVISLDKEYLKKDLESGITIPGANLIQGTTLRVSANKKIKEIA